jgi:hypothetical protein
MTKTAWRLVVIGLFMIIGSTNQSLGVVYPVIPVKVDMVITDGVSPYFPSFQNDPKSDYRDTTYELWVSNISTADMLLYFDLSDYQGQTVTVDGKLTEAISI